MPPDDPIPPEMIRDVALSACAEVYPDSPCTEPCDACWTEARLLLEERHDDV